MATQPQLMASAFASGGAKNTIPQTTAVLGKASLTNGFPTETSMPLEDGGIPPRREDFNGMLYWLSTFAIFQQAGGLFTYNSTVDYSVPSIIYYNGDLWWCLQANGPSTVVKTPNATNSAYWIKLKKYLSNPLDAYPVGSYYISSVSTSPATLFGGTWVQVRDKMILAAGTTYTAGTLANPATGGSATKSLTVPNIPSHTHTFTTANAGKHTHTVSGSTQTAGAHTHNVEGSTATANKHSHTRGTMNITGQVAGVNNGYHGGAFDSLKYTLPGWMDLTGSVYHKEDVGFWNFDASKSWTGATSEVSAHSHTINISGGAKSNGSHTHTISITVGPAGAHTHTGTTNGTGSGTAFDIMPPYIVAYVWRRTA